MKQEFRNPPKWDTLYTMQKKLHGKECRDDLLFWGWSSGAAHADYYHGLCRPYLFLL